MATTPPPTPPPPGIPKWWKEGVCYQIWPLSFKAGPEDTSGSGTIRGITSKLDYLSSLGIDYVWLSPMYTSPRNDYGYDIADYENVDPRFGTLADLDELIAGLKARGMRLILDLVVNHTSSEHRWFKESRKSRTGEFSNYYIWRDGRVDEHGNKRPPNNWKGLVAQESAWIYAEERDQWYLHLFLDTMPDLNWEDPVVRKAIYKSSIEFWLKRGVAGFRVDVVNFYSKDITFPDAPVTDPNEEFQQIPAEMVSNGPGMHPWLQEQRREALDKYGEDVMMVGEANVATDAELLKYINPKDHELDMVFDFEVFHAGGPQWEKPWEQWTDTRCVKELRKGLMKPQRSISELGVWATTNFESHDQPRSLSTFGSSNPDYYWQSGKLLALTLAAMSGTLFVYQGQEIGMCNTPKEWPSSEMRDPFMIAFLEDADRKYPDDPDMRQKARDVVARISRDHARTPVQWSAEEPYAGFSIVKPWMRVNENFRRGVNVEEQLDDPHSLRNFWRDVISFRKQQKETMIYGHTKFVDNENEDVLSVVKLGKDDRLLVVMNHSDKVREMPALSEDELVGTVGKYLFGTGPGKGSEELQPWEGRVFEVSRIE